MKLYRHNGLGDIYLLLEFQLPIPSIRGDILNIHPLFEGVMGRYKGELWVMFLSEYSELMAETLGTYWTR